MTCELDLNLKEEGNELKMKSRSGISKSKNSKLSPNAKLFSISQLIISPDRDLGSRCASPKQEPSSPSSALDLTLPSPPANPGSAAAAAAGRRKPKCVLESRELWERFSDLGTEMIITKTGRRMFPTVRISFTGLQPSARYAIALDILSVDQKRYRYAYHRSCWLVAGKADPPAPYRLYTHPDTPANGAALEGQIISFEKLKLTNNDIDGTGHIVLNSMHKYQPRVHLVQLEDSTPLPLSSLDEINPGLVHTFHFPDTVFTAVTAYQNQLITKLKIDCNPFAKGFRDSSRLSDYERDAVECLIQQNKPGGGLGVLDPSLYSLLSGSSGTKTLPSPTSVTSSPMSPPENARSFFSKAHLYSSGHHQLFPLINLFRPSVAGIAAAAAAAAAQFNDSFSAVNN